MMSSDDEIRISGEPEEDETIVLTDEIGRTITCSVERYLEVENQDYVLLLPIDSPVEIFVWEGENDDDEEAIPVENDDDIDTLFDTAKAVLEEQNLTLKRTAIMLTVEGELPEVDSEDEFAEVASTQAEDEIEELQYLASFYYEEQEFAIYAPLDPCFILARLDENNQPHLLSAEELQKLEPMLEMIEDQLFDEL
ncbi:MAG: DUF3727 domain-containing protein [Leptolyngbyaceae cyanobacterium bins.349]|nr:DUF3727 domain-containing protein [Leptolyngbyaceae cyanobacterium bins.349]